MQHGRRFGQSAGADYMEVHFEQLLEQPQSTLDAVGRFIDQPLDHETIQRVGYGSVSKPNTSFSGKSPDAGFNPIGRWKDCFSPKELTLFERMVGTTLTELGYALATDAPKAPDDLAVKATRLLHRSFFDAKFWYKNNSALRSLRPRMKGSDIDEIVLAEDHPPPVKQTSARS